MFRFMHGYREEFWPGLEIRGLIDDTSGVKLFQLLQTAEERKFNEIAKVGGKLYQIVKECNRPFYIDRFQGGMIYYQYKYDKNLIKTYQEISGDWMLGMQMHEWVSNLQDEWDRITLRMGEKPKDFSPEAIAREMFYIPSHKAPLLTLFSPVEYSKLKRPLTLEAFYEQLEDLYSRRQKETDGLLLATDSYSLGIRMELRHGTKMLMPEIGGNVELERHAFALTRGMAKDAGIKWGAYYEGNGGDDMTFAYYKNDYINEWELAEVNVPGLGGMSPNGGSSRSMQKRLFFHALMSGASFLSEETGICNTFYDWEEYNLTPYGQVKKEFLSFAAKHRNYGDTVTPVALVLPREFEIFDIIYLVIGDNNYLRFPIKDEFTRRQFGHLRKVLNLLLGEAKHKIGREHKALSNSSYGDVFDIVYDDVKESTLAKYDLIIDLNIEDKLASLYPNLASRIRSSCNIEEMEIMLKAALPKILPCTVAGELSWILNRDGNGYAVGLFNNDGVSRSVPYGETYSSEADTIAVINAPNLKLEVVHGSKLALRQENGIWYYMLPAGQVAVLRMA